MHMRWILIAAAVVPLAACEAPPPPGAGGESVQPGTPAQADVPPMPPGLTAEEQVIWRGLTPQAKRDAAAYIAAGGTLTQFVAI